MALFLNMDIVPPEMRPKGRGAAGKAIKVTVLKQSAKVVELQHSSAATARSKHVTHCRATFPVESVVLYEVEVVEVGAADAPAPKKAAPKKKAAAQKKAAPKKKGATKKKGADRTGVEIRNAIRANKGPMKMPELVEATEYTAPQLRKALAELVEEGLVEKEGAGRSMVYGLVRKKRGKKKAVKKAAAKGKKGKKKAVKKKAAKKAPAKKKATKRKGRKSLDDAPTSSPTKKGKKKKKGKKSKKKKTRFGSSRRKSSFKLDPDDE
jgi:histone H1/5